MQKLESTDFDEKKEINKRKQLILEGKVKFFHGQTVASTRFSKAELTQLHVSSVYALRRVL